MPKEINYDRIPEHCRDSLKLYVEHGVPTGNFLHAVLSNDLVRAFALADHINEVRMKAYAAFLYNEAPRGCWGSPEAVKNWAGLLTRTQEEG